MTLHSATNLVSWGEPSDLTDDRPPLQLVQDPAGLAAMDAYMDQLVNGASQLDHTNLAGVVIFIYARISNDKEHSEAGVLRQLAFLVQWVERWHGNVAARFVDNDRSISTVKARKRRGPRRWDLPRPAFDRMIDAANVTADAGQLVLLLSTETSRYYRTPRQFVDLAEYAQDRAGQVDIKAMRSKYDLTTRQGRRDALNAAQKDFDEAEETSERLVMYNQRLVREGVMRPGRRAFGWQVDPATGEHVHDEGEAQLLRGAYSDLLAGVPQRTINDRWEHDGVQPAYWDKATKGQFPWSKRNTMLKGMLLNPKHAGHQCWRGQVVNVGRFEPIVPQETWDAAQALLTANNRGPGTKGGRGGGRGVLHPFTGLLVCGRCGDEHTLQHSRDNKKVGMWVHNRTGCYMTVTAHKVEPMLWQLAVERVSTPTFLSELAAEGDDGEHGAAINELQLVRAKRQEVEGLFNKDKLTAASYTTQLRLLSDREAQANAVLARTAAVDPVAQWLASNTLSVDATTLPDHVQRSVLHLVYRKVRIHPATNRGRFTPDRVEPVFVDEGPA